MDVFTVCIKDSTATLLICTHFKGLVVFTDMSATLIFYKVCFKQVILILAIKKIKK